MRTRNIIIIILAVVISISAIIGLKLYVKSKEIPIDISYKKFEEYEDSIRIFAKENDFKFSSHDECFDDSCHETIMLYSNKDFNMDFEFNNFEGIEEYKISINSNHSDTNVFSLIDYDMIDEVFNIIFNKSYKDKLKEMSGELSKVNRDGAGKTMYLDRKNDITAYYVLHYGYISKGVKSGSYSSSLIIEKK